MIVRSGLARLSEFETARAGWLYLGPFSAGFVVDPGSVSQTAAKIAIHVRSERTINLHHVQLIIRTSPILWNVIRFYFRSRHLMLIPHQHSMADRFRWWCVKGD